MEKKETISTMTTMLANLLYSTEREGALMNIWKDNQDINLKVYWSNDKTVRIDFYKV